MKAMILAAGKGRRMMPLSQTVPKPLLRVNGKALIERHLERLVVSGFTEIVVNLNHLGEQIADVVGDGSRWGANVLYSRETELLETGGGITQALDLLGVEAFVVVNGDVWSEYDFSQLPDRLAEGVLGHLVMVDNPEHHSEGDFAIDGKGFLAQKTEKKGESLTWSGISLLSFELFSDCIAEPFPLIKLLDPAVKGRQLTAEHYKGFWSDVGTVERYEKLQDEQSEQQG
jgi:MurNAc alpha-1-phosphate uridylyltransferase